MIIDFNIMSGTFPDGRRIAVNDVLKLLDHAHIDRALISPPGTLDDTEENLFLYRETRQHLDRLIPIGILNPKRSQAHEEYDRIMQYGFSSIKFDALNHGYQPVLCYKIDELLEKIHHDHSFICMTTGITTLGDPAQWLRYIRQYPQLNFIFLGMGAFDFGYACVNYARQHSNIYLETSLQYEIQIIKKAMTTLASQRLVFGSGLPVRIPDVELIKLNSMGFSAEQLAQITHITAQQLLE